MTEYQEHEQLKVVAQSFLDHGGKWKTIREQGIEQGGSVGIYMQQIACYMDMIEGRGDANFELTGVECMITETSAKDALKIQDNNRHAYGTEYWDACLDHAYAAGMKAALTATSIEDEGTRQGVIDQAELRRCEALKVIRHHAGVILSTSEPTEEMYAAANLAYVKSRTVIYGRAIYPDGIRNAVKAAFDAGNDGAA